MIDGQRGPLEVGRLALHRLPALILELLGAMQKEVGPAAKVEHGPARPGDVKHSRLSVEKIRRELGWSPKYNLASGLAETI